MHSVKECKIIHKDIGLIVLQGRIDQKTDDEINDAFDKILDLNGKDLIIDFTEVTYINSTGIATVMGIVKEVYSNNHKNYIVKLNSDSKMMFEAIGLDRWVVYCDDLESVYKGSDNE
ncbi:MAG TPA: STAS domain-containing protein [Leptospiraceae bacterium]|nr:STAS domain-containing protein [Leptospiraceae bacterium]